MCGIAGVIETRFNKSNSSLREQRVLSMLRKIKYRGPDGDGLSSFDTATIGNIRLNILDKNNSKQPIISTCSGMGITYNGEVYNYRDMYLELRKDHNINKYIDTDIVLHSFEEWGVNHVRKLNGMFAYCIVDRNMAYLFRDRLGIKPLYYRIKESSLIFASEAKCLITENQGIHIEDTYKNFETNIGYETLYSQIFEIPPGSFLKFDMNSGKYSITNWYTLVTPDVDKSISEEEATNELRFLVDDAIQLRTTNLDYKYGCFVSGGLDSSVVALRSNPNILLSSITKKPDFFNEEKYISILSERSNKKVQIIEPSIYAFPDCFVEMVYALDFPTTTLAGFLQFILSQTLNKHGIRVAISGIGADEYLGGYARHMGVLYRKDYLGTLEQFKTYRNLFGKLPDNNLEKDPSLAYFPLINRSRTDNKRTANIVSKYFKAHGSILSNVFSAEASLSFPNLLRTDDRINMYFGIEARSPFLDYRLIEFSNKLPDSYKVKEVQGKILTKYILRKAFEHILPEEITWRLDKVGFPSPVQYWLKNNFKSAVIRSYNILAELQEFRGFTQDWDDKEVDDEFSRKSWQLLQLAAWYLLFIERNTKSTVVNILFS